MLPRRYVLSDTVADETRSTFREHARRIHERLPDAEVRHTGGTSVPGILTGGDVDLQVRTDKGSFDAARDALCELYEPYHPDVWHSEGAFFFAPDTDPPVELALTVIGSLDDLHHGEAWQRIADDPVLIAEYNAFKREHERSPEAEYNAAKREFFYSNFRL